MTQADLFRDPPAPRPARSDGQPGGRFDLETHDRGRWVAVRNHRRRAEVRRFIDGGGDA